MIDHVVEVQPVGSRLAKTEQLAWRLAEMATDPVEVDDDVATMIVNRVIDNAGVAMASVGRSPVVNARAQALRHAALPGASVFGALPWDRVSCEWAAWANGVAVRELDYHDTFLAAEYSHPGDNIPPLLAVAQHRGLSGADLVRGLAAAYEVQIDLATGISLHAHKIDHVAHLGPSVAAGIGAMLRLPTEVVYQAIQQALHTTTATRQSRKGEISSWKAYAPAFAGKVAIEAVDRAMRGETSPSPIYEGTDGVIAQLLDGPAARYVVPLPAAGRGQAGDPVLVHQGALGRVPEPGADRPRGPDAREGRRSQPGQPGRDLHQPPHPLRHRHRRAGPAEDGSAGQPGNPRPLDHVHLRRRARRRRLAPRGVLLPRAGFTAEHGCLVAQGVHSRRP